MAVHRHHSHRRNRSWEHSAPEGCARQYRSEVPAHAHCQQHDHIRVEGVGEEDEGVVETQGIDVQGTPSQLQGAYYTQRNAWRRHQTDQEEAGEEGAPITSQEDVQAAAFSSQWHHHPSVDSAAKQA